MSTSYLHHTEGIQPNEGWFEYLYLSQDHSVRDRVRPIILSTVFGDEPGFTDGNIGGFAQAADDTREVIDFMHTHPVSVDSVTPVPLCDILPGEILLVYDVSISEESGLQVPTQMVDGSEGREFIVTVANARALHTATGTVTVTAIAADGVASKALHGL